MITDKKTFNIFLIFIALSEKQIYDNFKILARIFTNFLVHFHRFFSHFRWFIFTFNLFKKLIAKFKLLAYITFVTNCCNKDKDYSSTYLKQCTSNEIRAMYLLRSCWLSPLVKRSLNQCPKQHGLSILVIPDDVTVRSRQ